MTTASTDQDHGWQQAHALGAASPYRIRPLHHVDLDGISQVHWRACRVAYRFMSWSYTEDEVRHWYAGKLEEWDWGQVVCAEDLIVAYLAASGAYIDQLFVDPDHQRVGLGRALLTAMLERRLRPATLHVFAENGPARAFYERFGFRKVDAWWDVRDRALALLYRSNSPLEPKTARSFWRPLDSDFDDRDLLPGVQLEALDGHRDVLGVEPRQHLELAVGDLVRRSSTPPVGGQPESPRAGVAHRFLLP